MVCLPLEGMLGEPAASFPSYTRVQFTGHAPLKMLSRSGALSLKCLRSTKSGAFAVSLVRYAANCNDVIQKKMIKMEKAKYELIKN